MISLGFPEGDPDLVKPVEWYNERYLERPETQTTAWVHRRNELIWGVALEMAHCRIIDVGCGEGYLAELVDEQELFSAGSHVYVLGVDGSRVAIERARRRCPAATFATCALSHWATSPAHYDAVMFLEVLEHVYTDLDLLLTVPAGKQVVLSVPNFECAGHCRWFGSIGQAYMRYRPLLDVTDMHATHAGPNEWYIMAGVRR